MKKLMVAVLGVLFFAPAVFADNWGLGLKLGYADNDPKDMKAANVGGTEFDDNGSYFGLEALYEWNLDETNKIGAKIGLDTYGENELKIFGAGKVTEDTYSFPITVYYKQDYGVKNWSWFAGAGMTFLRTELDYSGWGGRDDDHKSKVFPHITAGAEYRFTELFALGLDARYNFAAKVKKDGVVYSDRSGFGAAISGRFYF